MQTVKDYIQRNILGYGAFRKDPKKFDQWHSMYISKVYRLQAELNAIKTPNMLNDFGVNKSDQNKINFENKKLLG